MRVGTTLDHCKKKRSVVELKRKIYSAFQYAVVLESRHWGCGRRPK